MKKILALLCVAALVLGSASAAWADPGEITNPGSFAFTLFVVAGDSAEKTVEVAGSSVQIDSDGDYDYLAGGNVAPDDWGPGLELVSLTTKNSANLADANKLLLTYKWDGVTPPGYRNTINATVSYLSSATIEAQIEVVQKDYIGGSETADSQTLEPEGTTVLDLPLRTSRISRDNDGAYGYAFDAERIEITGRDADAIAAVSVTAADEDRLTVEITPHPVNKSKSISAGITVRSASGDGVVTIPVSAALKPAAIPSGYKIEGLNTAVLPSAYGILADEDVVYIPITAGYFLYRDKDGREVDASAQPWAYTTPSASQLSGLRLKLTNKTNFAKAFDSISLNESKNRIEIRTQEFFNRIDPIEGSVDIALSYGGITGPSLTVNFVLENEEDFIDEGQEEVYTDRDAYFTALATVRGVRLHSDNGVTAVRNLSKNQQVYFRTTLALTKEDEALFLLHDEIFCVVTLISTGIEGAGTTIEFDPALYGGLHVYDRDFQYLGLADSPVPFSHKYYLTTEKLSEGGGPEEVELTPEEEAPEAAPEVAPPETHNPNTGR